MTDMVEVPPQRTHSRAARTVDCMVKICALVPYALVALGLRTLMARVFFYPGQDMIQGPKYPQEGMAYAITLPVYVREETVKLFEQRFADTPLSPKLIAYVVAYAEFVLPILLVIGLATRFTAFALLLLTALIDRYLAPDAFWSLHIYWYAILLVLLSAGPGMISADYLVRRNYES